MLLFFFFFFPSHILSKIAFLSFKGNLHQRSLTRTNFTLNCEDTFLVIKTRHTKTIFHKILLINKIQRQEWTFVVRKWKNPSRVTLARIRKTTCKIFTTPLKACNRKEFSTYSQSCTAAMGMWDGRQRNLPRFPPPPLPCCFAH